MIRQPTFRFLTCGVLGLICFENSASADLIPNAISGVTPLYYQAGDNQPNGDGSPGRVVDGGGVTVGDPLVPSTWTHDGQWQQGWQAFGAFIQDAGSTSAPTPDSWFVMDLGAVHNDLDSLYVWNVREVLNRATQLVDIWYTTSPTAMPVNNVAGYKFAANGWTQLQNDFTLNNFAAGASFDNQFSLAGINARYIGFDMLTNYGSNFRVGFAELQVTTAVAVPEPSILGLLAIGMIGMILTVRKRLMTATTL